jgi:hypothetical protein
MTSVISGKLCPLKAEPVSQVGAVGFGVQAYLPATASSSPSMPWPGAASSCAAPLSISLLGVYRGLLDRVVARPAAFAGGPEPKSRARGRTPRSPTTASTTAVRNDREDRGNVGIIRSPVRARSYPTVETRHMRAVLKAQIDKMGPDPSAPGNIGRRWA